MTHNCIFIWTNGPVFILHKRLFKGRWMDKALKHRLTTTTSSPFCLCWKHIGASGSAYVKFMILVYLAIWYLAIWLTWRFPLFMQWAEITSKYTVQYIFPLIIQPITITEDSEYHEDNKDPWLQQLIRPLWSSANIDRLSSFHTIHCWLISVILIHTKLP